SRSRRRSWLRRSIICIRSNIKLWGFERVPTSKFQVPSDLLTTFNYMELGTWNLEVGVMSSH
ncbi:MAG: hypothetical protein ACC669_07335, partial [bacterium]